MINKIELWDKSQLDLNDKETNNENHVFEDLANEIKF